MVVLHLIFSVCLENEMPHPNSSMTVTNPVKINLEKVLEQNILLHEEIKDLKQQLYKMSQRIQHLVSGEVERLVALDVENQRLKRQVDINIRI